MRSLSAQGQHNARLICLWRSRELVGSDKCGLRARGDVYALETDVTAALLRVQCGRYARNRIIMDMFESREG